MDNVALKVLIDSSRIYSIKAIRHLEPFIDERYIEETPKYMASVKDNLALNLGRFIQDNNLIEWEIKNSPDCLQLQGRVYAMTAENLRELLEKAYDLGKKEMER